LRQEAEERRRVFLDAARELEVEGYSEGHLVHSAFGMELFCRLEEPQRRQSIVNKDGL